MKEGKTEGNGKEETFSSMTEGEILERSLYRKLTTGEAWHNDKSGQSTYTHIHPCTSLEDNNDVKQKTPRFHISHQTPHLWFTPGEKDTSAQDNLIENIYNLHGTYKRL